MARLLKTIPNRIDLHKFGQMMSRLNLDNVPPHKRYRMIIQHLMAIQEYSLEDRAIAEQIEMSRKILNETLNENWEIRTPTDKKDTHDA